MKNHLCILFLSLFILLLSSCDSKPKVECSKWRTGEYELIDEQRNIHIERTVDEQIETDRLTNTFTKFIVQWMDDCTYRLYFKEGEERFLEVWKDNYLEVIILRETETGYAYQARFSTSQSIENYEIVKIK